LDVLSNHGLPVSIPPGLLKKRAYNRGKESETSRRWAAGKAFESFGRFFPLAQFEYQLAPNSLILNPPGLIFSLLTPSASSCPEDEFCGHSFHLVFKI
jgi:hypothetical protein